MKNKKTFILTVFIFLGVIILPKNVSAATSYENRHVCPKYEVALANNDGSITSVGCYNTYNEAKNTMNSNSSDNAIILD